MLVFILNNTLSDVLFKLILKKRSQINVEMVAVINSQ